MLLVGNLTIHCFINMHFVIIIFKNNTVLYYKYLWFMFSKIPLFLCIKYMLKPLILSPVPMCYFHSSCHQTGVSMRCGRNSYPCNPSGNEDRKPGWRPASRNRSEITDPNSEAQQKKSRTRPFGTQEAAICKAGSQGLVGNLGDS